MPHMVLEYSDNILDKPEHGTLLRELHAELVASGPYKMEDIKSRVIIHDKFLVSTGDLEQAFVHLQLAILPRPQDVMNATTQKLLAFLQKKFPKTTKDKNCTLSVEIRILEKESYAKAAYGTII